MWISNTTLVVSMRVRVKISCKDADRIADERTFGINGKFYKVLIEVKPMVDIGTEEGRDKPDAAVRQKGLDSHYEVETT